MNPFKSLIALIAKLFKPEALKMIITTSTSTLTVGASTQLTTSEPASYVSSDTSTLTVDQSGLAVAIAAGIATITATSQSDPAQTATADFTVTAVVPEPTPEQKPEPTPDVIDKLELILKAVGYKLPALWSEAVALAKKA